MLPTSHPHLPPYRLPKHSPTRGEEGGTVEPPRSTCTRSCGNVLFRDEKGRSVRASEARDERPTCCHLFVTFVTLEFSVLSVLAASLNAIGLRAIRDRSSLEGKERTRETHAAHRSFTVVDDVCYIGIRDEYRMPQLSTTIRIRTIVPLNAYALDALLFRFALEKEGESLNS